MEFRYRAGDSDRPPMTTDTASTQSLNPTFPFLSARPMPGPVEDHVLREVIHREIEKEKIRQEIIVLETARRRELIAEVVQEMAIESEMAMRRVVETRMSDEDKLTAWINQRKLIWNQIQTNNLVRQNQGMYTFPSGLVTSPMVQLQPFQHMSEASGAMETSETESNKDKLIVLNRPDSIGVKRKAEDTQNGLKIAKPKTDSIGLAKDPCLLSPTNKTKDSTAFTTNPISPKTGETASSKLPQRNESKPRHKFKYWCNICEVGAFCQTVMRSHELGKKHIAAIKQINGLSKTASTSFDTEALASVTAPQSKAITVLEMAAGTKKKEKNVRLWCGICKIRTYSEEVMETHKLGKKHRAMLEKL